MYRDKFRFSAQPATVALGKPELPAGKIKQDEFFGKVETYRGEVAIRVPVTAPKAGIHSAGAIAGMCRRRPVLHAGQADRAAALAALPTARSARRERCGWRAVQAACADWHSAEARREFLPLDKAFKVDAEGAGCAHRGGAICRRPKATTYIATRLRSAVPKDAGVAIAKVELPRGEKKTDPNFGEPRCFTDRFRRVVALDRGNAAASARLSVEARYQGCSEKGLCYPPAKKSFDLTLAAWQPAPPQRFHPEARAHCDAPAAGHGRPASRRVESAADGDFVQTRRRDSEHASEIIPPERDVPKVAQHLQVGQFLADRGQLLRRWSAVVAYAMCVPHGADPVRDHRWARASDHQAPRLSRCR